MKELWWVSALTAGKSIMTRPTSLGSGALPMTIDMQQLKDTRIKAGGVLHGAKKAAPEALCPALGVLSIRRTWTC